MDEIVIRRCPMCGQLYDTEICSCGCIIQPEKCCKCKFSLPLLIDGCTDTTILESKIRYYLKRV